MPDCDIAIVGGGLSGCLIALALAEKRPELDVRLIEPGDALGGNHIWSFFESDVQPEHRWLVEPLISQRWQGYDVRFPAHRRTLDSRYQSILSAQLDDVVRARIAPARIIAAHALEVSATRVSLDTQQSLSAHAVIDARGPADLSTLDLGWQKFLGQLIAIEGGHGLTRPIVMDATVAQIDGYRFVYCLPFDDMHVFVEDTYYSDGPALDTAALRGRIAEYATRQGWVIQSIVHEETGVLPVAMGGDFNAYWASGGTAPRAGLRAGLFHPLTGYSLPDAVALAMQIAEAPTHDAHSLSRLTHAAAHTRWRSGLFYRLLTRMLFRAAEPHARFGVLQQFYTRDAALIERFYAGRSTLADKVRILSGKPPVPISRALKALIGRT